MRSRLCATLSAVSHPGESTLSICICLRNAKRVAGKYRCFLEKRKERLLEWRKNRIARVSEPLQDIIFDPRRILEFGHFARCVSESSAFLSIEFLRQKRELCIIFRVERNSGRNCPIRPGELHDPANICRVKSSVDTIAHRERVYINAKNRRAKV